ncbi:MAG: hypothetical protein R3B48_25625 [Kofleriaceae bacterium]
MGSSSPLAPLIAAVERERDRCYVCDRGPLEEMLADLRRWARQLADAELDPADGNRASAEFDEPSTVVERPPYLSDARRSAGV